MKNRKIYNEDALERLKKKYGYPKDYLQKCIRGDRQGIMPDGIKKDYNKLLNISKTAITQAEI